MKLAVERVCCAICAGTARQLPRPGLFDARLHRMLQLGREVVGAYCAEQQLAVGRHAKAVGEIRQEIAQQRSMAAYSRQMAAQQAAQEAQQDAAARRNPCYVAPVRLPSRNPEIQAAIAQNIAALETKPADLGCVGAFSGTPAPNTSPAGGMSFDDCFAACKQYTQRSDNESFDACKR